MDKPRDGVDGSQLLFVGICLVGLVTAAFFAPATDQNPIGIDGGDVPTDFIGDLLGQSDGQPEGGGEPPDDGGGSGDGGGGGLPGWLGDLLESLLGGGGGEGTSGEPSRCQVYTGTNPTPGRPTTVLVTVDAEPADGVRVWFNDEFVGRTDERGQVTGEAPYVRELNVTVESPIDEPCAFSRRPVVATQGPTLDASRTASLRGRVTTGGPADAGD